MILDHFREHFLSFKGTTEEIPKKLKEQL